MKGGDIEPSFARVTVSPEGQLSLTISGFFGFLSGNSRFPNFIPPIFSTSLSPCQFIFSRILHSVMLRKNSSFGTLAVYNHTDCQDANRSAHNVLLQWTLCLNEHRLGQNGSPKIDRHYSVQGSA